MQARWRLSGANERYFLARRWIWTRHPRLKSRQNMGQYCCPTREIAKLFSITQAHWSPRWMHGRQRELPPRFSEAVGRKESRSGPSPAHSLPKSTAK
jgi:hypothetical protein